MDTSQLEDRISHLTRTVEDLSDVVARQEREIARLGRLVMMLTDREAEREAEGQGPAPSERPPHW